MKHLLFISALFLLIAGTASADYILIKIDVNKFGARPVLDGGGQPGVGPGGIPGAGGFQGGGPGGFQGGGPGGFPGKGGPGGGFPQPGGAGGGFPQPGGAGGGVPGFGMMGGGPALQPGAAFVGFNGMAPAPPPMDPNQPNAGGAPPVMPDDPDAKWISAVVEIRNRSQKPAQTPFGYIFTYEHKWSARTCWLPMLSPVAPWVSFPFVLSEPFPAEFSRKFTNEVTTAKASKDKSVDGFLYLARWALSRGHLLEFHKAMKEVQKIDGTHPLAKNYQRVKMGLQSPFKAEDPAQQSFLQDLGQRGYKSLASKQRHFTIYFDPAANDKALEATLMRRLALMEDTLESFYFWFALQKDSTIQPNLPKYRLNAVLTTKDEFKNRHADFGAPPMVGDGFTPRRDNVVVQSAKVRLGDSGYEEFEKLVTSKIQEVNQGLEAMRISLTREDLLSGKVLDNKAAGQAAIMIAAAQTAVLLEKALEDGAERHMVTHETVRQLLIASEMFPRNVQLPEWMIEGLAGLLETPGNTVYPTIGAPSWQHFISFKHHLRNTKKLARDNSKNVLYKVVTDGYFNDARIFAREAQEQPSNLNLQYVSKEGWELARCSSWAFVYYLAQKGKLDSLFAYGKELDKLPRDLDLNEPVLQASFGKAFNITDARNAPLLDDAKLQNLATSWYDLMQTVNLDPGVIQTFFEQERAKQDPPSLDGVVVSNPKTGGTPSVAPPGNSGGWTDYNDAAGGYSAKFPGDPMQIEKEAPVPGGGNTKVKMAIYDTDNKSKTFAIGYVDSPVPFNASDDALMQKVTTEVINSMAKGAKGTVQNTSKIQLGKVPGREGMVMLDANNKMKVRVYVSGSRVYMIMAHWDATKGDGSSEADFFHGSFQITGAGGNAAPPPNNAPPPQPGNPKQKAGGLANTAWTGSETLAGYGGVSFQFQAGGGAIMSDKDGQTQGNWNQKGNVVTITFPNNITYTGTHAGNNIQGTATNGKDNWNWTVARNGGGFNPNNPGIGRPNPNPGFPRPNPKGKKF